MTIELTPEEIRQLLNQERIKREIQVESDDSKFITIILSITRASSYPARGKKWREMTEVELQTIKAAARRSKKEVQRRTLASIGREESQGRTRKPWTEKDKRELRERISRRESSTQIALAMGRTYKSIRKARDKFREL